MRTATEEIDWRCDFCQFKFVHVFVVCWFLYNIRTRQTVRSKYFDSVSKLTYIIRAIQEKNTRKKLMVNAIKQVTYYKGAVTP